MSAFERLHPALQHHIVNSLGWRSLRPLQEQAVAPLVNGEHALLLAPTAGGKTEAALFPILSRMLQEDWTGLSVVYVCPIKALLNNLEIRLHEYTQLLGRRVAVWHGDVGATARKRILNAPPDLLLTTPESIEVVLTMRKDEGKRFFSSLRVVVVDEIHAFAGDDRGWHLLALLDRLDHIASRPPQRVGLSATVGNPEALLAWLTAGGEGASRVLAPAPTETVEPEVTLDYVGSIPNAAEVISRLHRGQKRLVFCDSRTRVEKLAAALRDRGVETFVSHSSLSLDERRRAEGAFATGQNCVIVATSTLELGLDVGDLDRVIQIDAPTTVASFLQRLGRTGRRAGSPRNCLFLATQRAGLLHAAGLLELWTRGYVEPIQGPPLPYHVLAQQVMALALQETGIARPDLETWLAGWFEATEIGFDERNAIVAYMLETGILSDDGGVLWLGEHGQDDFGRRNFMELFSVFTTPPLFTVRFGRDDLGLVDPMSFLRRPGEQPVLLLAGRSWLVTHIEWARKVAWVQPSAERGSSRWMGEGQSLAFELCRAMRDVLRRDDGDERWSRRTLSAMDEVREDLPRPPDEGTAVVQQSDGSAIWWTFAGRNVNAAIADHLGDALDLKLECDNLKIRLPMDYDPSSFDEASRRLAKRARDLAPEADLDELAEGLKFSKCVPRRQVDEQLRSRLRRGEATKVVLSERVRHVRA